MLLSESWQEANSMTPGYVEFMNLKVILGLVSHTNCEMFSRDKCSWCLVYYKSTVWLFKNGIIDRSACTKNALFEEKNMYVNTINAYYIYSTFQSCFIQEDMFWAQKVFLSEHISGEPLLGAAQYNQPWTVSFWEFSLEQNWLPFFTGP